MSVLEFATGILLPISPGGQDTCLIPQINLLPFLLNLLCEPLFLGSQGVLDSCFTYIIASSQLGIYPANSCSVCARARARHCSSTGAGSIFLQRSRGEEGGQEEEGREGRKEARMDLSGTQGELPMPMHAAALPYVGLHHENHHHHHTGSNGRHMSPPTPPAAAVADESKNRQVVAVSAYGGGGARYRECLKNHAAAIGGRATDGCGEFMPAGEDGSLDALRCSACGCHRNFHRKELDHPDGADPGARHHHLIGGPLSPLAAHRGLLVAAHAPTRMVMPLSAMHTSESDEAARPAPRKRSRTKFTAEQKARMLGFAEEVGWRLQKLEDAVVQRFCQEVGVKRRVLKVWMHNNKHTLARRHQPDQQPGGPGQSQSQSPSPSPPQLRLE